MNATSTSPVSRPDLDARPTRLRLVAVVAGTLVAVVTHLVALAAGADMLVPDFEGEGTQQLATIGVAASAAGAALIGWGVAWAAGRFASRPRRAWLVFALVGLVLSFAPVLAIEAATLTQVVLALQHLLVAAVVMPLFARTLPTSAQLVSA